MVPCLISALEWVLELEDWSLQYLVNVEEYLEVLNIFLISSLDWCNDCYFNQTYYGRDLGLTEYFQVVYDGCLMDYFY